MINNPTFKPVEETDFFIIKEIYDYYITHTTITFHTEPKSISELKEFIYYQHPLYHSYLVFLDDTVVGYCYYTHFDKREAYEITAEISVYLKPEFTGKGIGGKIINFLENDARKHGIKIMLALVSGNNFPSIKLFQKHGYEKVGVLKRVGRKLGQILDVCIFEKEI